MPDSIGRAMESDRRIGAVERERPFANATANAKIHFRYTAYPFTGTIQNHRTHHTLRKTTKSTNINYKKPTENRKHILRTLTIHI